MTAKQKIALRTSEVRQRLAEIVSTEGDLTMEQRSELDALRGEYADLETRSQALILPDDPQPVDNAAGRELRSIVDEANLGDIFEAAIEKRSIDGATRELQEHYGLAENQVPPAVSETTGAFSADVLTSSRIQASFIYRRTDMVRFAGMDAALREALSGSLMEAHDAQILTGSAGLFTGTNLADNDASAVHTFKTYLSEFGYDLVDGRYAHMCSDLRLLIDSSTYSHMGTLYQASSELSAADVLSEKTGVGYPRTFRRRRPTSKRPSSTWARGGMRSRWSGRASR